MLRAAAGCELGSKSRLVGRGQQEWPCLWQVWVAFRADVPLLERAVDPEATGGRIGQGRAAVHAQQLWCVCVCGVGSGALECVGLLASRPCRAGPARRCPVV